MEITTQSNLHQDDQELVFFRSLKSEMYDFTTKKMVKIVRVVLTSVVKNLPSTQVSEMIKKLPSTLQLIFVGSWSSNDESTPAVHLDQLVENVCKAELKKEVLFTNEVEALKYVLIVIKNLKIVFDRIGISIFPYSIMSEYQQAVQEEAG